MEGLVNYSSEEEQDESSYRKVAERGSPPPLKKRSSSAVGGSRSMREPLSPPPMRLGTTGLGGGGGVGVAGGAGRSNCKEENASARHRRDHWQDSRSSMHRRERPPKEARDARNYGNGHGNSRELKVNERQRSKDYRSESYRSNHRRTPRNDRNRQSSSTTQHQHHNQRHRDRYSDDKPRHGDDKSSSHRYQRLRDERSERPERTERNERPERSTRKERPERKSPSHHRHRGDTRSPTPPPPPTPPPQHYQQHTKRSSHYDKRSRTPSRSRSHTPTTPKAASCEHVLAPLEKARLSALEMERKLNSSTSAPTPSEVNVASTESPSLVSPPSLPSLPSLPLNENVPKQPNVIISMPIGGIAAANATPTVIQLPSYYNPSVINPNKYAEQMQKRKLLWSAKKSEDTAAKWGHAQFSQDSDGKVASKFMRLMGIKGDVAAAVVAKSGSGSEPADGLDKNVVGVAPDVKSREAMFSTMEHQYEVARQVTHTMRGVGLGFGSQSRPF